MPGKRSYRDPCGIARSLDLIGQRWALLVVRELILGPKRFSDLRDSLEGIATDVLAQRLKELEASGIVTQRDLPAPAASRVYELTERGRGLEPVLLALGRWGAQAAYPTRHHPLGTDAFVVALKTTFDPARAQGLTATYALILDGVEYAASVADGRFDVTRGLSDGADARIESPVRALPDVVFRGAPRDASITVSGDAAVADRFFALFGAPAVAPTTTA
jgi:DNA-binding HxlR family transcriptional regulator